jgi:hypothetical protein
LNQDLLQKLADKQAIYEVVLGYCRGIDRLDMDKVRAAYHPGGLDHHTGFSGPIEEFVAWVEPALRRFAGTTHIIGNHMAEVMGDTAVSETYGTAVHWGESTEDPARNFTSGFRYIDHMIRREGVWKIQERWAAREWTRSDAGLHVPKEGKGPSGSRGPDDPLTALRRRMGLEG